MFVKVMRLLIIFTLIIFAFASGSKAGLIRDAQTEEYLHNLADPIAKMAGISPQNLRLFIIADSRLNAFVAGGSNIFINTGLITETTKPEMLLAVLAHEMGHIQAGHLISMGENIEQAQVQTIVTYLLGAAAAAAGSSDVAMALITGGGHLANRGMMAHTRGNEQAADQAAINFFEQMNLSTAGMVEMFELLRRTEKRYTTGVTVDSYARTHPLSRERITHIRAHSESSQNKSGTLSKELQQEHIQVKAKLIGFIEEPNQLLITFNQDNQSIEAKIIRSVAYMRLSLFNQAKDEVDGLIKQSPQNPYLHELKGYILYEARLYDEAIISYEYAHKLKPNNAILASDYAKSLLASNNDLHWNKAKDLLEKSSIKDPTYQPTWRNLAKIYGRGGEIGKAELCLAEIAALNQNKEELLEHLSRAKQSISKENQTDMLRLEDLENYANTLKDKENDIF
jgi:predicted Zn-dependent protease